MVQQIEKAEIGILLDDTAFPHAASVRKYLELAREVLAEQIEASEEIPSLRLHEEVLEVLKNDAGKPIHDKLSRLSLWWLLECIPLSKHYLTAEGQRWKRWS